MWRMLRSRQTWINALLLVLVLLAATAWSQHHARTAAHFVREVFLPIYVSFLLPIFSLCYASHAVAGERQEQTLGYLLATPLTRPVIYLAKWSAALALVLVWNLGGAAALGRIAGPAGWTCFVRFWPAVLWSSVAYGCLFHLFSVLFRRATVVSLVYALFLETFLGNVPGVIKRVAISYYTQCLVIAGGQDLGLGPAAGRDPALFVPLAGDTAQLVLWCVSGALFAAGMWVFCRRVY